MDALQYNDQVELDLTAPVEKEEEVKNRLSIRYGAFYDNLWSSNDPVGNKVCLCSPTIGIETAKRIVRNAPSYVNISVSGVYLVGTHESIYRGPLKLSRKEMKSFRDAIRLKQMKELENIQAEKRKAEKTDREKELIELVRILNRTPRGSCFPFTNVI